MSSALRNQIVSGGILLVGNGNRTIGSLSVSIMTGLFRTLFVLIGSVVVFGSLGYAAYEAGVHIGRVRQSKDPASAKEPEFVVSIIRCCIHKSWLPELYEEPVEVSPHSPSPLSSRGTSPAAEPGT